MIINTIDYVEFVKEKLTFLIPNIKQLSNRWNFRCPLCGDSVKNKRKRRGNYILKYNYYRCYNAGCEANEKAITGLKFVSMLSGDSYDNVKKDFFKYYREHNNILQSVKSVAVKSENKPQIISVTNIKLNDNWVDIPPSLNDYIEHRRILKAPNIPKNWKLYYNIKNNSIVIPYIEGNTIVYYQERLLNKNSEAKYIFPADTKKRIFGIDKIDSEFKYIFLLEGVFDSIFVKNGVAIGGLELTQSQRQEIDIRFPWHEKVFMFDNNNVDKSAAIKLKSFIMKNPNQKFFLWDKNIGQKDVNDYIISGNHNIFYDPLYLESHIEKGVKALLLMKGKV